MSAPGAGGTVFSSQVVPSESSSSSNQVSIILERDYFMTAEEAVVYGIIDRVLTHRFA